MSKVNNIMDLLESGLRAESLRQRAIANNVANLETPGYRTKDVKFEDALAQALEGPGEIEAGNLESELFEAHNTPLKDNGNDVVLDAEVGKMVKNTLRHTAYMRLLSKKYQQMRLAMEIK